MNKSRTRSNRSETTVILGVETSCDETALALIEVRGAEMKVLAALVHSQADLHSAYGGVYPALAKREHGRNLVPLLHKLLSKASSRTRKSSYSPAVNEIIESFRAEVGPQNPELFESFANADFLKAPAPRVDAIAVTEGPGLEPALWVGINFARMLGALWNAPVMPIDHMEGHIIGSLLPADIVDGAWRRLAGAPMPSIALLISGGHTELVRVDDIGKYEIIGATRDDAVGEAFDKAARLLSLPYPGGPHLAELARQAADEGVEPLELPRPMIGSGDLDFSFAGLKTAVLYAAGKAPRSGDGGLEERWRKAAARGFEEAVRDVLAAKLEKALEKTGARSIIAGGGVSANRILCDEFQGIAREHDIPIFLPSKHVSGDNALMIAAAGALHFDCLAKHEKTSLRAHGTKKLGSPARLI